ncbi:hypothetical protein [Nocardia yunnanensis]|uniref:hypothetical protein n=1 Tax=Nocardia yunnanensis TaxID=2382165 RepID=UPI0016571E42
MIAYRAMLDVSRELVCHVSRLLAAQRRARGTRRGARALTPFRQAMFVLAWFRKREDIAVLGAGFGISRSTACGSDRANRTPIRVINESNSATTRSNTTQQIYQHQLT